MPPRLCFGTVGFNARGWTGRNVRPSLHLSSAPPLLKSLTKWFFSRAGADSFEKPLFFFSALSLGLRASVVKRCRPDPPHFHRAGCGRARLETP